MPTEQRVIRVFVSSTFRDMHAEREELVKRVFPQLRKLCESRGVTWGEVDLRWGVTDEQKAEGEVLPICLAEIRNCRPYFLGLLGERYGWVPEEIDPALLEQEPWLAEHRHKSVTELEILHGVLNDPAMAGNAFFYLRDPTYVRSLPPDREAMFREVPSADEIAEYGADDAAQRAQLRRQKVQELKARVRASGLPVRDNYSNPQTLGRLVLADLTAVIERLYPQGSEPDPLDRVAAEHEFFAASRARVYIGRNQYFDRLDAQVENGDQSLVVLGESGVGKSALLANWALRHRASHPDDLLLMHFIGASPNSADWAAMLRRIVGELNRHFDLNLEIPHESDALRESFSNALHMASARGLVILVLDALNQLEDREGAQDLVWLPLDVPNNVRLIVSTLPGRSLDYLKTRAWPTLEVEPLDRDERERLIVDYLAQYTKSLSPSRVQQIADAEQTRNPLYLVALLEELRVWGDHFALDQRIAHYLAAAEIDDLYEKILHRYEEDYERDRPGLVSDAMSLISAARRGLSEAELLDLLGSDGEPLPSAMWSPLFLAAEQSLAQRAGLIGFSHDYFRRAVRDRYLPDRDDLQLAHLRLADYFDRRKTEPRGLEELPWQLVEAASWDRLYDLLADAAFFDMAWDASEAEVKTYWTQVEDNSSWRLTDAYRDVLQGKGGQLAHLWRLAVLFHATGHVLEAQSLRRDLIAHARNSDDRQALAVTLGPQALLLIDKGELKEAMSLLEEQEQIYRELDDDLGLQGSLGNQSLIRTQRGELDEAMALLKEQERICRAHGQKVGLQASLGNQSAILYRRGQLDAAMTLSQEKERICRELGDRSELATALGNQAVILQSRGELEAAMALHKEEEQICRAVGDRKGLARSLGNQGALLGEWGRDRAALALHKEVERICRDLGDRVGLAGALANQALAVGDQNPELAAEMLEEAKEIFREVDDKQGLARSVGNHAAIEAGRRNFEVALSLFKEEGEMCRELGDLRGLAKSLMNQGLVLGFMGRQGESSSLIEEAHRIASAHGHADLARRFEEQLHAAQRWA